MTSRSSLQRRHAFTLVEIVVAFVLLAIVSTIGVFSYKLVVDHTAATGDKGMLRQTAASLQLYQQSRQYFPTDTPTLQRLEPGTAFTGPSGSPTTVHGAVSVAASSSGGDRAGLATLTGDGTCLTMIVYPAGSANSPVTASFTPDSDHPCSGFEALNRTGSAW